MTCSTTRHESEKSTDPSPSDKDTAEPIPAARFTAFANFQRVAAGSLEDIAARLRANPVSESALIRVFDDSSGALAPLDLRAPSAKPLESTSPAPAAVARGVGRPKLGVVAREVTLLPRHWDWLSRQPGGASVALRRLVEDARRVHSTRDRLRAARETTYRFMSEMAGDLPGFEEASRALFASDEGRFMALIAAWPTDLRAHLRLLSDAAWKEQ